MDALAPLFQKSRILHEVNFEFSFPSGLVTETSLPYYLPISGGGKDNCNGAVLSIYTFLHRRLGWTIPLLALGVVWYSIESLLLEMCESLNLTKCLGFFSHQKLFIILWWLQLIAIRKKIKKKASENITSQKQQQSQTYSTFKEYHSLFCFSVSSEINIFCVVYIFFFIQSTFPSVTLNLRLNLF